MAMETPFAAGRRDEKGQSAVELALVLPVLLLLFVTAIDFGRVYYTYSGLANSVRAGAVYATTQGASLLGTVDERKAIIRGVVVRQFLLTPSLVPSEVVISGTTMNVGDSAFVEGAYSFAFLTPLARALVGGDGTLRLRYRATIRYT